MSGRVSAGGLGPGSGGLLGLLSHIWAHRVATAWSSVFPPLWPPHYGPWYSLTPFTHSRTNTPPPTYSCSHINMYTQTHDTHTFVLTHQHLHSDSWHPHTHTYRYFHTPHRLIHKPHNPHPHIPTDTHRVTHIHVLSHTTGHSHLCTHNPFSHTHLHICESGKVIYYAFWGSLIPLELGSNSLAWHLGPVCHVEFQHVYAALPSPTPLSLSSLH